MPRWYAERDYDDPAPEPCEHECARSHGVARTHLTVWKSEGECIRALDTAGLDDWWLLCEPCRATLKALLRAEFESVTDELRRIAA